MKNIKNIRKTIINHYINLENYWKRQTIKNNTLNKKTLKQPLKHIQETFKNL